jgi:hypothetical protein
MGGVVVLDQGSAVQGIDVHSGTRLWQMPGQHNWVMGAVLYHLASPPVLSVVSVPRVIRAHDGQTGRLFWERTGSVTTDTWAKLPVAHGAFVVETRDDLVGGDIRAGAVRWKIAPLQALGPTARGSMMSHRP